MRSTSGAYLEQLDHVRGAAAMLVLVYHSMGNLTHRALHHVTDNPLFVWIIEGHTGVSLFLVLSGFVLTIINAGALEDGRLAYGTFLWNRFVRVGPLLIFMYLAAITAHIATLKSTDLLPLLLLQLTAKDAIGISSEWAVAIEFQCYLLFPFLLAFARKLGTRYLLQLILLLVIVRFALAGGGFVANNGAFYFSLIGRLDQFVVGMIAAIWYLSVPDRRRGLLAPCLVLAAAFLLLTWLLYYGNHIGKGRAMYGNRVLYSTLFHLLEATLWASVLLAYLLLPPVTGWVRKAMAFLGEISYSLYLMHTVIVVLAVKQVLPRMQQRLAPWTDDPYVLAAACTLLVVVPASVAVATLSFRVIERPFMQFRRMYAHGGHARGAVDQPPAAGHAVIEAATRP